MTELRCVLCHHRESEHIVRTVYANTDGWHSEYCRECTPDFSRHAFTAENVPTSSWR